MRTKSIAARKHRKILKRAKGFKQARSRRVKAAKEALLRAGQYAYEGRKRRKRDLKSLWIMRLNAAARKNGLSYSKLMARLKAKKVGLDRKILSEIAVKDPATFKEIILKIK